MTDQELQKRIEQLKEIIAGNQKTVERMDRDGFSTDAAYWKGVRDAHKDELRFLEFYSN